MAEQCKHDSEVICPYGSGKCVHSFTRTSYGSISSGISNHSMPLLPLGEITIEKEEQYTHYTQMAVCRHAYPKTK